MPRQAPAPKTPRPSSFLRRFGSVGLVRLTLATLGTGGALSACQRQPGILPAPSGLAADRQHFAEPFVWKLPEGFPEPKVPADNPMTYAKVALGRQLFYDKRMSHNGTQSCATCHQADKAFTDGLGRSVGSTGAIHPRGSESLINAAYMTAYTWGNPLIQTLEAQAMVPLFSQTPIELGNTDAQELIARFDAVPAYRQLFGEAFPQEQKPVNLHNLTRALAAFERTLISAGSPYDRYFYGGDENALSEAAKRGNQLFFSEKTECNHCHSGFNLVDSTQHANTKVANTMFNNTALYNLDGHGSYPAPNRGVFEITHNPADMGRFRAQTLRNIAITAPYFHDGSAATLDDVLDHYAAGGRTISQGPDRGNGAASPLKSQFVIGFSLSAQEREDLHAFFDSLTDTTIAKRSQWQEPEAF